MCQLKYSLQYLKLRASVWSVWLFQKVKEDREEQKLMEIKKLHIWMSGRSRWWRKRTLSSPPPRNTSKIQFSAETLQARREWHDIFKVMKGKNLQQRLLYPAGFLFRFDGEIKSFTDKQKLREFNTTKRALQQMLKELL